MVELADIRRAAQRIAPVTLHTPLLPTCWPELLVKPECLQRLEIAADAPR